MPAPIQRVGIARSAQRAMRAGRHHSQPCMKFGWHSGSSPSTLNTPFSAFYCHSGTCVNKNLLGEKKGVPALTICAAGKTPLVAGFTRDAALKYASRPFLMLWRSCDMRRLRGDALGVVERRQRHGRRRRRCRGGRRRSAGRASELLHLQPDLVRLDGPGSKKLAQVALRQPHQVGP